MTSKRFVLNKNRHDTRPQDTLTLGCPDQVLILDLGVTLTQKQISDYIGLHLKSLI